MVSIKFVDHTGEERVVDAKVGDTVMQVALDNMVEGIVAECGGSCSCGTCHCFLSSEWRSKIPEASELEIDTIECALEGTPESRLACQVVITEELDGLVVGLPEEQL